MDLNKLIKIILTGYIALASAVVWEWRQIQYLHDKIVECVLKIDNIISHHGR